MLHNWLVSIVTEQRHIRGVIQSYIPVNFSCCMFANPHDQILSDEVISNYPIIDSLGTFMTNLSGSPKTDK